MSSDDIQEWMTMGYYWYKRAAELGDESAWDWLYALSGEVVDAYEKKCNELLKKRKKA